VIEGETEEIGEVAEIGFFDCTGFQAERQGIGIGGDGDGGHFEKFLFEVTATGLGSAEFGVGTAE
jgi:hypothetical protein